MAAIQSKTTVARENRRCRAVPNPGLNIHYRKWTPGKVRRHTTWNNPQDGSLLLERCSKIEWVNLTTLVFYAMARTQFCFLSTPEVMPLNAGSGCMRFEELKKSFLPIAYTFLLIVSVCGSPINEGNEYFVEWIIVVSLNLAKVEKPLSSCSCIPVSNHRYFNFPFPLLGFYDHTRHLLVRISGSYCKVDMPIV